MKRLNLAIFGLVICLVLSACYYLMSTISPPVAEITPQETTCGQLALLYPQTEGLGSPGDKINQVITQEVSGFVRKHNGPGHSGQIGYKVELNQNNLLSIKLRESVYVPNTTYPMSYQRAFTFNTETGAILRLADLFLPGRDYFPKINELAKQQLAERRAFLLRPYNGITANQEFYLTPDAVIIYYQPFEYTPYVCGFLELSIPYEQLSDLLRPDIKIDPS